MLDLLNKNIWRYHRGNRMP